MTTGTGFTTRLAVGVAELLAAAGVAEWRTEGAYTDAEAGIVLWVMPARPDRVLVLSVYLVDDDPTLSDSTYGVQVRTRSAPYDAGSGDDLADAVFDELHNYAGTLSTGVKITGCERRSSGPLGQDPDGRYERSCNYYVTAHRPSKHRT